MFISYKKNCTDNNKCINAITSATKYDLLPGVHCLLMYKGPVNGLIPGEYCLVLYKDVVMASYLGSTISKYIRVH